jgi:hypothetical protein
VAGGLESALVVFAELLFAEIIGDKRDGPGKDF